MAAKKPNGSSNKPPLKTTTTPVRNSAVPRIAARKPAVVEITHEMISVRAYQIWQSGQGGSEFDNWCCAERELRGR